MCIDPNEAITSEYDAQDELPEIIRFIYFAAFEKDAKRVVLELERLEEFMRSRAIARPHFSLLRLLDGGRTDVLQHHKGCWCMRALRFLQRIAKRGMGQAGNFNRDLEDMMEDLSGVVFLLLLIVFILIVGIICAMLRSPML